MGSSRTIYRTVLQLGTAGTFLKSFYHKVASSSLSWLVKHFWLLSKENLMVMHCDLWPKEFKIE